MTAARPAAQRASSTGVLIEGVDNLMIRMAKCCKPETSQAIVGYVTRNRGITIHTKDCSFVQRVPEDKRDRLLDTVWAKKVEEGSLSIERLNTATSRRSVISTQIIQ